MAEKPSKVEEIKARSQFLRGHLAEELVDSTSETVSEEGYQLLKFHGVYAQDDRDQRRARKAEGRSPAYSFMVRAAIPGGILTADQYLAMDQAAEALGIPSLRITTRQGIQFHGVKKTQLKSLIRTLNQHLVTTWAGCGDVERNLTACPAPATSGAQRAMQARALELSRHLKPRSHAYVELWMDQERVWALEAESEPLYGPTYLPRKFKTGMTLAGHNCIDVFSQDIGIVAHPTPSGEGIEAYTILAGGGLGKSHGVAATHPALAQVLGEISEDRLVAAVEAIVTVQRDFGNRSDRKYARMKYLIESWGLERFRAVVEERMGFRFLPSRPLRWESLDDHLGWHLQDGEKGFLGLWIENGRIVDTAAVKLRTALREVIARYRPGVRLTPQQNLLLTDLRQVDLAKVEAILVEYGVEPRAHRLPPVLRHGMACPALPTCGLALTEAERVFPDVLRALSRECERLGLSDQPITVRMTGCPNNCARPFTAEIGLVGRGPGRYNIYLGGTQSGTKLAELWKDGVALAELVPTLAPLLRVYASGRRGGESFGDWYQRVGAQALAALKV
jgi:sulfite reductase (ferredoxin)